MATEGLQGERLKRIRQWRGMSQEELGQAIGTSQAQIGRYETGKAQPTAQIVIRLAKALSVPSDYLLGLIEEPQFPHDLSDKEREIVDVFRRMNNT